MAPRRILLIDVQGPFRDALARVLASEGHEVRVADAADEADRVNEFAPETVVYREGLSRIAGQGSQARWIALTRPVNMEELRRALRED